MRPRVVRVERASVVRGEKVRKIGDDRREVSEV